MKILLDVQIAAVERAVVNLEGHVAILRDLIAKKKRDPIAIGAKESWLPELQAALNTLKWLRKHEETIKDKLR